MQRMTRLNPDGKTYRAWADQIGTFRMESQGGEVFLFGDLINKLGEMEDREELAKRNKK